MGCKDVVGGSSGMGEVLFPEWVNTDPHPPKSTLLVGYGKHSVHVNFQFFYRKTTILASKYTQTVKKSIFLNLGIQAAYKAYRNYVETHLNGVEEPRLPGLENFTPNQIFWMTFGYGWCMKASDDFLVQMVGAKIRILIFKKIKF